jgi:diguanylate cyclase (GGDEF)-like protein/PAS domain S-box-containing protein
MQNEELIQARTDLEDALQLYTDLYDFSPVGYLTLTSEGTIIRANLAVSYLLGIDRGELINQRLELLISPQSLSTFRNFFEQIFTSGNKETCEVTLIQKGDSLPVWVHMEGIIDASDEQREACRIAMVDISKQKQAENLLREQSTHDALTGLYNRSFFMAELSRLERGRNFPVSVVMADVDQLKHTNDHEGHAAGDHLLKRVAEVLMTAFRADDVVARIGGDEFAVLLPNTNAKAAEISIQRVRKIILQVNKDQAETPIQLSLGASTAVTPGRLEPVLHEADVQMYHEKRINNPE